MALIQPPIQPRARRCACEAFVAQRDANGTLYGTTPSIPNSGCGTVYSIGTSGTESVLYRFTGGNDGCDPEASLIYANGLLYGTTFQGGGSCFRFSSACGTVFSISTSGSETVLYRFAGGSSDGAYPHSALIEVNGTLYGTTMHGGDAYYCSCGTVYRISKSGKEKMLFAFVNGDGMWPTSGLVDVGGTLYGTAPADLSFYSTVYSITPQGEAHNIYQFHGTGASGLIAVNGTRYGTLSGDGIDNLYCKPMGCGMIYSITTSGEFQVLHDFTGRSEGAHPEAALLDVNGTLYGTTVCELHDCLTGKIKGVGTVFSLTL